ncbi:MAG: dTDP-glucose 4,6-dehydratase [Actinobacteria bacterium]|nr:dTDP-glucose 4,6-dehydratase [Actinomycetota bacterium]
MRLLVTGGAGFIGSNYVRRRLAEHPGDSVRVLDKLTYAGRTENLEGLPPDRLEFTQGDIADRDASRAAVSDCDAVVNFAAESHVDRSIDSPGEFITTDVFGTFVLLEASRDAGIRHLQVSTDEVYGDFEQGTATETSPLEPSSPYSASKAGGDLLVSAFARTYGADALIIRASNNYGPRQHPEKLIPLCVLNALAGDPLPVYGDGMQVRNWLYVEDCCAAIDLVLEHGEPASVYNVGGPDELPNIEVVKRILELTGRDESLISYTRDRPGHDRRYSLSAAKLNELGWRAEVDFAEGIERTIAWYRENEDWWGPIRSGEYAAYYERHYGQSISSAGSSGASSDSRTSGPLTRPGPAAGDSG